MISLRFTPLLWPIHCSCPSPVRVLPATSIWPSAPTRPNSQRTAAAAGRLQLLVGEVEQPHLEIQRRDGLVAGIMPALFEKHAVAGRNSAIARSTKRRPSCFNSSSPAKTPDSP